MTQGYSLACSAPWPSTTHRCSREPRSSRRLFERGPLVIPPTDFGQIARTVTERRVPIAVADAPTAHLDIYTPDAASSEPRPVILWVHGGGFISSSAGTVGDNAILLAHAGYTVASLDYSLAPGARYPVPIVRTLGQTPCDGF